MKKIAYLFTGQGSQIVGMGRDFYEKFPVAKEMFEAASDRVKIDLKKLCFEENELLGDTRYAQPAILTVSCIANALFMDEAEIKPHFSIGHSLGEFSALVAAGALDFADAVYLVHKRGEFMTNACEGKNAGMSAVLGLGDETAEEVCKKAREEGLKVWCANFNSDGQIVLAGAKDDLAKIEQRLKDAGAKRVLPLAMSVASHCELLLDAEVPLYELLEAKIKDSFLNPIVSNVTAEKYSDKKSATELLRKQLTSPVAYKQSVKKFEDEVELFIEFGGSVLAGLNKRLSSKPTYAVTDSESLEAVIQHLKEYEA